MQKTGKKSAGVWHEMPERCDPYATGDFDPPWDVFSARFTLNLQTGLVLSRLRSWKTV